MSFSVQLPQNKLNKFEDFIENKKALKYVKNLFQVWKLDNKICLFDLMGLQLSSTLLKIEKLAQDHFTSDGLAVISKIVDRCHQGFLYVYLRGYAARHGEVDNRLGIALKTHRRFPTITKLLKVFTTNLNSISIFKTTAQSTSAKDKVTQGVEKMQPLLGELDRWLLTFKTIAETSLSETYIQLIKGADEIYIEKFKESPAFGLLIDTSLDQFEGTEIIENGGAKKVLQDVMEYAKYVSRMFVPQNNIEFGVGLQALKFPGLSEEIIHLAKVKPLDLEVFRKKMGALFSVGNNEEVTKLLNSKICAVISKQIDRRGVFGGNASPHYPSDPQKEYEDLLSLLLGQALACGYLDIFSIDIIRILDNQVCLKKDKSHQTLESHIRQMYTLIEEIEANWEYKKTNHEEFFSNIFKCAYESFQQKLNRKIVQDYIAWNQSHPGEIPIRLSTIREKVRQNGASSVEFLAKQCPQIFKAIKKEVEDYACTWVDYACSDEELANYYRDDLAKAATPLLRHVSLIRVMHLIGFLGDQATPQIQQGVTFLPEELIDLLNLDGLEEKICVARRGARQTDLIQDAQVVLTDLGEEKVEEFEFKIASGEKVSKLAKRLVKLGLIAKPGRGDHMKFFNPDTGGLVVVPLHDHLKPGTAKSVESQVAAASVKN